MEDREKKMWQLLEQCVDVMRTTQRLIPLSDNHLLMLKCREVERWLDGNEYAQVALGKQAIGYECKRFLQRKPE